jgi:hypothetical protein
VGWSGHLITAYRVTDVGCCTGRPRGFGLGIYLRKGVYRDNPSCEGNPVRVAVQT